MAGLLTPDESWALRQLHDQASPGGYDEAPALQIWMIGMIRSIKSLGDLGEIMLGDYQIGEAHFGWSAARIDQWQRTTAQRTRDHIAALLAES